MQGMSAYRTFLGLACIGIAAADSATMLMLATDQMKYFGFALGGLAGATIGIAGLVVNRRV